MRVANCSKPLSPAGVKEGELVACRLVVKHLTSKTHVNFNAIRLASAS